MSRKLLISSVPSKFIFTVFDFYYYLKKQFFLKSKNNILLKWCIDVAVSYNHSIECQQKRDNSIGIRGASTGSSTPGHAETTLIMDPDWRSDWWSLLFTLIPSFYPWIYMPQYAFPVKLLPARPFLTLIPMPTTETKNLKLWLCV